MSVTAARSQAASGLVLVTGASGFIGRDLTVRLASAGWRVRAAARNPATVPTHRSIECVALPDLAGDVDWTDLLTGVTHVVHLAGIAHATSTIAEATYMAVNADAVESLARASAAAGVQRLVIVSSVRAQVGPTTSGVLDESRTPAPVDTYGASKLAGERQLAAVLADAATDWCVLRPVVLYGPGVKGNVASLVRLASTALPLPLAGLAGRRSLLGLETFASAVLHVLLAPAASGGTYLVAEPGPLTVGEIVAALREGRGRKARVFPLPSGLARFAANASGRGAAFERLAGDLVVSTEALEATSWQPRETARKGLMQWMREKPG